MTKIEVAAEGAAKGEAGNVESVGIEQSETTAAASIHVSSVFSSEHQYAYNFSKFQVQIC